ncbi:VOC family protein [Blastococcus xanthinilyticus]|uniref:Glyoxalase/bleomycin resistance protein/dioxygenase superfamily protein n=1 Tax=Blastococcus xanthinilyticus TaxID=1564164 RepID=A0A5S5D3E8_9ACTN|nr:VOC family protein [Blastococcus xanthinilyticus]TYP90481.1 glyoxalase/bleomycin resistance protein/dioxygenase superfamily protein [Blastococcus xanthinilyticus]
MALHRLTSITMGVPNVEETAAYYTDFGLTPVGDGWFATRDGGRQLRIVATPTRRLVELHVGADDADDIARVASNLRRMGIGAVAGPAAVTATEKATGVRATVEIAPRVEQNAVAATAYNGPGRYERTGARAPGVLRTDRVQPRKLGHVVVGSTDVAVTQAFFTEGLGFKLSDVIKGEGAFMRCSVDHHNLLVLRAPVTFLHHSSWQVDDVDEVGRGAMAMLEDDPDRHVWGLGRHHAGSNFFWYLKDPAGNFSEYYSDMDCIVDDQLWTPEILEGAKGLFNWGPPPPASFLKPEDLAALMTGAHSNA